MFHIISACIHVPIDIQCDNLTIPSNGGMSCSSGIMGMGYEGETCTFTCNTGYELIGSSTRTCQSDGNWSGSQTRCIGMYIHPAIVIAESF